MPAVTAAVGETSKGNMTTILRSGAAPTLRVGRGNRTLTVDSNKRVPQPNADRVDGRNANQLPRVADDRHSHPPDHNGGAAPATITVPAK